MVNPHIHRVQTVPNKNFMESFHWCEVASFFIIFYYNLFQQYILYNSASDSVHNSSSVQ